jgi:hypothetical protein
MILTSWRNAFFMTRSISVTLSSDVVGGFRLALASTSSPYSLYTMDTSSVSALTLLARLEVDMITGLGSMGSIRVGLRVTSKG